MAGRRRQGAEGRGHRARLVTRTLDGIPVPPLYPAADVPGPSGARPACRVFARLDADGVPPRDDVENGADGLVLAFAGAGTARGFGIDPAALADALDGIAIEHLPLRIEPAPFGGLEAARALLEVADRRNIDASALDLDAGIDPLGFLARTGRPRTPGRCWRASSPRWWAPCATEASPVPCSWPTAGRTTRPARRKPRNSPPWWAAASPTCA